MTENTQPEMVRMTDLDTAYRDRSYVLSLIALHYTSYIAYSDKQNPDWPVLTLETPHGQMTWHVAQRDLELFPHVRRVPDNDAAAAWDGHSTEEKHQRIMTRVGSFPAMGVR